MITFTTSGNFSNTERYLNQIKKANYRSILEKYAAEGVKLLSAATPKDTARTADAWNYEIITSGRGFSICWTNSNLNEGIPIAILLQYGHATRSGSFVEGQDYINPTMRPLFDKITENLWKEVAKI